MAADAGAGTLATSKVPAIATWSPADKRKFHRISMLLMVPSEGDIGSKTGVPK
jgi:hypothetical protein